MENRVLVALDINDPQDAAHVAAQGAKLAVVEESELHLLNVVPDSGMALVGSYMSAGQSREIMEQARKGLAGFASERFPDLPAAQLHVLKGTIYDKILRKARDLNARCIVVGASRPELRDYLVGPNAAKVVRHAPQSVFVVRA